MSTDNLLFFQDAGREKADRMIPDGVAQLHNIDMTISVIEYIVNGRRSVVDKHENLFTLLENPDCQPLSIFCGQNKPEVFFLEELFMWFPIPFLLPVKMKIRPIRNLFMTRLNLRFIDP